MKKFLFIVMIAITAISFIGCSNGTSYKYEDPKPIEETQKGVTYTIIDKDRQFIGYYTQDAFVYFFVLKNENEYRVLRVDPRRYYSLEIGSSITVY